MAIRDTALGREDPTAEHSSSHRSGGSARAAARSAESPWSAWRLANSWAASGEGSAATQGAAVSLALIVFFFWTLETRFKRRKALKAIHEIRALVHVIDMHQLAKNPEQVSDGGSVEIGGRPMDGTAMAFYLQFCAELLSLTSKVGHLYVQDFPDATSLTAADQIETLATGLSNKIWQKIMILQTIRSEQERGLVEPLPRKG